jgi:hypothetical protein
MASRKKVEKIEKSFVDYKGEKYELVFNLNVMEEIQEAYGSVEEWGDLVEASEEPKAKDIKFGFTVMLNEGIDIYNEEQADDEDFKARPFFTEKQVGRIISDIGLMEAAKTLNKTVIESTKSDEKN